ncbi:MAG: nucleotide sugar dehydrogenase [Archangium sp.]|nr:nucleotide sugar dehydrogenase [Archangium sp.]MDP3151809.1 nucleotide sugar dehydrogenase [Archangium sp.]MDP3573327.1 nucleotide sugar dehydrogenase [Archangium sp.]
MSERVAIIGLGYVGLPVALAFARKFPGSIGFDINVAKVKELRAGFDRTGEVPKEVLQASSLEMTWDPEALKKATFFVVAVPTPVDSTNRPDLTPVVKASETVARALKKGDVVVYESTVYPGVTEEVCGPLLAKLSGLTQGVDFKLGYSPERINPGDKLHTLERITKVVSGEDAGTLDRVADTYGAIIEAGVFKAASIKVAEAAKVIENTQRDLNIALMNELALIFDRMGIRTRDVLAAAGTKWNFLKFSPGLVGGHCIGVDPYYLTTKAEELGYQPQVILAGRRINNEMGPYIAQRTVKLLVHAGLPVKNARVGVFGLTFKENVADIRNSKVPDIIKELKEFGIEAKLTDVYADPAETKHEYGLGLTPLEEMKDLDALILAVSHQQYVGEKLSFLVDRIKPGGVLVDVKSALNPAEIPSGRVSYWCL